MGRYAAGLFIAGFATWILLVFRHDAGPRSLALVVDPRLSRSDTFGVWATNVGQPEGGPGTWRVSADRSADETLRVELTREIPPHRRRIEFWFKSESRTALRVRGREGTYDEAGNAVSPVYDLQGTVTVNRSELSWRADEPLLLRFDLNGWECGSDAPHTGLFEIPESAMR